MITFTFTWVLSGGAPHTASSLHWHQHSWLHNLMIFIVWHDSGFQQNLESTKTKCSRGCSSLNWRLLHRYLVSSESRQIKLARNVCRCLSIYTEYFFLFMTLPTVYIRCWRHHPNRLRLEAVIWISSVMWSSFNLDCINCINCPLYTGLQILYLYGWWLCHRPGRAELQLTAASHLYLSWPPVTSIMLVTNCGFISQILIISFYSPAQHCLCLRWSFTFRPTDINLRGREQVISYEGLYVYHMFIFFHYSLR